MSDYKNIKPTIEEINKGNPFVVPDNYFEIFHVRMADKIGEHSDIKAHVPNFAKLRPQYATIIAFSAIALFIYFGVSFLTHKKNKPLSAQEIAYVYEYSAIRDLSDEQLYKIISEEKTEISIKSDTITTQDQKEIIKFLSNEDTDISTIINAL